MNKWKVSFFVMLAVTVIGFGLLAYSVIDQAITINYMGEGYKQTDADLKVLAGLMPAVTGNLTQKDVLFLLRKLNPNAFIVEEQSSVQLGQLTFEFDKDGKLKTIRTPQ